MNWDDIKIFLAMVRHATVRAAADLLGMSHSTVARRIISLEKGLGVRLFDRTTHGYELTPAGKDILATAEGMEREVMTLERRVIGRDQKLTGHVRVATSDFLATHLLIPGLPAFGRQYPEINVEIVTGYESLDIDRREADIALRITPKPPPHLVGKRLAAVAFAPFVSRDYLRHHDLQASTSCWIGYQRNAPEATPDWVHSSAYLCYPNCPPRVPAWVSACCPVCWVIPIRFWCGLNLANSPQFWSCGCSHIAMCVPPRAYEHLCSSSPGLSDITKHCSKAAKAGSRGRLSALLDDNGHDHSWMNGTRAMVDSGLVECERDALVRVHV
jgi:DNA-binding transcriptional LysR family regulator